MTALKTETVNLNGHQVFYSAHGKGQPLFLLHGYGQSSDYWLPYIADFQDEFEVYLVDLAGHGRSEPFKQDWSVQLAAQNLNELTEYLGLDIIYAIGLSYGGDILYQLSVNKPNRIKSMVTIGCIGTWNAKDYPAYLEYFSRVNLENLGWMKEYQSTEKHFLALLDYFPNYQMELSNEQLQIIAADILIVMGDNDNSIPMEEIVRARKYLQRSDLWILPDSPHVAFEGQNKNDFIRISKAFLKRD